MLKKILLELEKRNSLNDLMFEGINIDDEKLIITYDNNTKYLDTKNYVINNINGIKTFSLFKRKKYNSEKFSDSNPLIYALKGLKGWKINKKDKEQIYNDAKLIIDKINLPKIDSIIKVPSSNVLVRELQNLIIDKIKPKYVLEDCLVKRTIDEIIDEMDFSTFTKQDSRKWNVAIKKMRKDGIYFQSKYMDKELLKKMEIILYKESINYFYEIFDKNILIIDDVLSSGKSISDCSKIIKDSYSPKNIYQLTLFSKVN